MELRHLRYFVSVAEASSVSKAALCVHISQPALSRQIRDLEVALGLRLFDRVGRRIQLTAEGEDLLRESRRVLAHAESLVERARSLVSGGTGILRVGATPQAMQSVLAGFLPKFQRARPGVDVRLSEEGGVRLYELVERGELHLALSGILAGHPLECRPLFPIRVLAVMARRSRWSRRKTIEITELASEPLLVLGREFGSRQLFDAACRVAHVQPRVILESHEPHSLITLAEAGQGIAVVPSTVRFVSKRVRIVPLLHAGESLGVWGGLAWDPRRSLPIHAARFIEDLAVYAARCGPGRRFDKIAPPLSAPPLR
ncbi:MAG TPA: LysR family transcriptional regulator [Vicinamibacterales bacterium]|nr:LysR family transcriptional regulator [Vicinamibacterales bacterium]